MSDLSVDPAVVDMSTLETLPWQFDTTNRLASISGGTVTSPSSKLTNLKTGDDVVLTVPPSVSGNLIEQIVVGSKLQPGVRYRLAVTFTANTDNVQTMELEIRVLF